MIREPRPGSLPDGGAEYGEYVERVFNDRDCPLVLCPSKARPGELRSTESGGHTHWCREGSPMAEVGRRYWPPYGDHNATSLVEYSGSLVLRGQVFEPDPRWWTRLSRWLRGFR